MEFLSKFFHKPIPECSSPSQKAKQDPETKVVFPLVFLSGSKMPNADRKDIDRFRRICEAIGEMLGHNGFGVIGCPPHVERILASQCAKVGLLKVNPAAPFSTAGVPDNRLYAADRIRFVRRASAAVFIGGSDGTLQEYLLCKEHGIDPVIPIAGAGGAGAELARRLSSEATYFWSHRVDQSVIAVLCNLNQEPEIYAKAVFAVLSAHPMRPKNPPIDEEPITGMRQYSYIEDDDWDADD